MEKGRGKGTDTLQTDKVFTRKEYIEREAAKNAFPRAEADAFENCRYCTCLDSEQIDEILDNIPAADVVPVRHGRWIEDDISGIVRCSFCDNDAPGDTTGGGQYKSPYCQSCGALMDKDGDGK